MVLLMNIASEFKKMRVGAGLNQPQLAEKSGLSVSYISRLENGDYQSLSLDVCQQLSKGLGVTLKSLLETLGLLDGEKTPNANLILQNALRSSGLTAPEAKEALDYVAYLKDRRRRGAA